MMSDSVNPSKYSDDNGYSDENKFHDVAFISDVETPIVQGGGMSNIDGVWLKDCKKNQTRMRYYPELKPTYSPFCLACVAAASVMFGILLTSQNGVSNDHHPCPTTTTTTNTPVITGASDASPSKYLIESAQNRSEAYDGLIDPKYLEIADHHPAFTNIADHFQPNEDWKALHMPDINIIGLPKAGTSQLYNILTSHAQLRNFHRHSEFCFNIDDDMTQNLVLPTLGKDISIQNQQKIQQAMHIANEEKLHSNKEWLRQWENLNLQEDSDDNQRQQTVNKCLVPVKYLLQRQYLQRQSNSKIILLLRDPTDWMWSSWNYWTQEPYEDVLPSVEHNWASLPSQCKFCTRHHHRIEENLY
jgi:hypothetical protein